MAKAITNSEALVSMGNCDDSIAEIDAMIPRLLKMKKQLAAQKEYIEVALKDANDSGNTNAAASVNSATNQNAKIVDFRANLYKHQQKIQRLASSSTTDGTQNNDITTGFATSTNIDITRAKKNGGGLRADIFTASQHSGDGITTQETLTNTNIFEGVDLVGAKKFLIGINSILTQTNDISSNATSTEAIIPYSSSSVDVGKFSTLYVAGGTHTVNEEILRGLVMRANDNEKGQADLSEENGINIREVAGEEIIADESFAQITSRPANMTDNSTGWLIPQSGLSCVPAVATNLKPTLIVKNNKLLKVKVEKGNSGIGHQADNVFTVSKEHIPGTSDMTGNIYTNTDITQNINGAHSAGFYKITSGITSNIVGGSGMEILIQIASVPNIVTKIIIIAGAVYKSGEIITVAQSAINTATGGDSTSDLKFTLNSDPGNYDRFVYSSNITATGASDGISQISDNYIKGTGSNMSIIATVVTAKITDIVIIPGTADIRGYQANETISITNTALSGSSIDDFILTKCPSCCDSDLVLKLIKVPGATNQNATDNRGNKIRGFGL